MFFLKKSTLVLAAVLLIVFSLVLASCTPTDCTSHKDSDNDGKCDVCSEEMKAKCTAHKDADDNGKCDSEECDESFFDGCDTKDCTDTDGDGKCDNDGCDKPVSGEPNNGKTTLTVKVVDEDGNVITGGKIQICKEGEACQKPVSLDENGTAVFEVEPGVYYASFASLPEGYSELSESKKYYFTDTDELTVTLTNKVNYTVSVLDPNGNFMSDIIVHVMKDGNAVATNVAFGNSLSFTLPYGSYTVELEFNTGDQYHFDATKCILTPEDNELSISLYLAPTEKESVYAVPKYSSDHVKFTAYYLKEGCAYVTLKGDEMTYFLFRPEIGGVYELYADTSYELYTGYYGNPLAALAYNSGDVDESGKKLILNIRESSIGGEYLVGVRSDEAKKVSCAFTITRVSDPITSPEDEPYDVITSKLDLSPVTLGGEGYTVNVTNIDISKKITVVLGDDGYYHIGSKDGDIVYVRITTKSDYIDAFSTICDTSAFNAYFYDEDGSFLKKEIYNDLIWAYAEVADELTGLYPLTEELAVAIKNHGEYYGWWNATSGGFIFSGIPFDLESAWLFACATVEITED